MPKKASFFDLVAAMKCRHELTACIMPKKLDHPNEKVLINGIVAEDGTGRKWSVIVTIVANRTSKEVFWDEDAGPGGSVFYLGA